MLKNLRYSWPRDTVRVLALLVQLPAWPTP